MAFRIVSFAVLCFVLGLSAARAQNIRDIVIEGAKRSDPESILLHVYLQIGDAFDEALMDQSLKALHATGRFRDVALVRKGSVLVVRVLESPIINRIAFEGNKAIKDGILETETELRPLRPLTKAAVKRDAERLLQIYRRYGRFAARVRPRTIALEQNRVDLVYEIAEGKKTKIRRIDFLDNKTFARRKLLTALYSGESRFYRLFGTRSHYNPDRYNADKQALENFYRNRGFADMRIASASAELTRNRRHFVLTLSIAEGPRYRLRQIDAESALEEISVEQIKRRLSRIGVRSGIYFNAAQLNEARGTLLNWLARRGFSAVAVEIGTTSDRNKGKIDLVFKVFPSRPVQIARVEFVGNVRTLDHVLRRELDFSAGDILLPEQVQRSVQRLRRLGYFSSVEPEVVNTEDPQKVLVRIRVQERQTGSVQLGAGYSTQDAFFGQFSFGENNFRGRGQRFSLGSTFSRTVQQVTINYGQRYLGEQPLNPSLRLSFTNREKRPETSYGTIATTIAPGIRFDLGNNWSNSWSLSYSYEEIKKLNTISAAVDADSSRCPCHVIGLGYSFLYSSLNDFANPNAGQLFRFGQTLADFGGTSQYLRSEINYKYYQPVYKGSFLKFDFLLGNISSLGKPLRTTERYLNNIRGFRIYGIGPRENFFGLPIGTALGADNFVKGSLDFNFPFGLPKEVGLRAFLYVDVGLPFVLSKSGLESISYTDHLHLRASAGGGLAWQTPIGPLQFTWSRPFSFTDYDRQEKFTFSIGAIF